MGLVALGSGWQARVERVLSALSGTAPDAALLDAACRLLDELVTWNARIDLTAARSADELVDLMFADAAALLGPVRRLGLRRWVDVGAGAGAPGLAFALLAPEASVTLVEPLAKRVAFLRTAVGALGRADVQVRRARSESLEAAAWEGAMSRATLPPEQWLAEGARLATGAVVTFLARGDLPASPGLRPLDLVPYEWPLTGAHRRLVVHTAAGLGAG